MRIVTWADLPDLNTPAPVTGRIEPGAMKTLNWTPERVADRLDPDSEAVILAHPWRTSWAGDPQLAKNTRVWTRKLVDAVMDRCEPAAVFLDHPANGWRTTDGNHRLHPDALDLFSSELLEPFQAAGATVCQYGAETPERRRLTSTMPCSPVLWSLGGTSGMLDWTLATPPSERVPLVPWFRGVGQWSPNDPAGPDVREFLHQLLAAGACGASWGCVWFNPWSVTPGQQELMARCIDMAAGHDWQLAEDGSGRTDMDMLLEALQAGGFDTMLRVLSRWGQGPEQPLSWGAPTEDHGSGVDGGPV